MPDPISYQRQLRYARRIINDALSHAATAAARCEELFEGTDEAALFRAIQNDIFRVRDDTMAAKALSTVSLADYISPAGAKNAR